MAAKDNLASLLEFFPANDKSIPVYGQAYKIMMPEGIYRNSSYSHETEPANQPSYVPLPIQTEGSLISNAQYKYRKQLETVQYCPYDFHYSVDVPYYWTKVATFDHVDLQNLTLDEEPRIQDLKVIGTSYPYDIEISSTKSDIEYELPLVPPSSLTLPYDNNYVENDPEISEFASQPSEADLRVFATSETLAAIGVCCRATLPYDLLFTKKGKNVFVSLRKDDKIGLRNTFLETILTPEAVSRSEMTKQFFENIEEVTMVNAEFSSLTIEKDTPLHFDVVKKEPKIESPVNPDKKRRSRKNQKEPESEPPPPKPKPQPEKLDLKVISGTDEKNQEKAYVYRKLVVSNIEFIIRGEIECITLTPSNKPEFCMARSFIDIPSSLRRVQWTKDLINTPTAVFSHEASSNSSCVGRWAANAVLTGVSKLFIGFSMRKVQNSSKGHVLIGVQKFIPINLNLLIALSTKNMYAIFQKVFSCLIDQDDGEYEFVRDPVKRYFTLLKIEPPPPNE